MAKTGVVAPIVVLVDEEGRKWLVDGRHRLEAVKSCGEPMIEALVFKGPIDAIPLLNARLNSLRGRIKPSA
ncbi:hypothetical protein B6U99_04670, partial [Candidatus Geothermarchaeota archaeon ex4572_27]